MIRGLIQSRCGHKERLPASQTNRRLMLRFFRHPTVFLQFTCHKSRLLSNRKERPHDMDAPDFNSIQLFHLTSIIRIGFLPGALCRSPNTISGVRSKKPISLFQLTPHLQCCKPMNCCFIFRPQLGQTLLFLPITYRSRLSGFNRKSIIPITTIPFSLRHSLILSFTTIIFLKESSM